MDRVLADLTALANVVEQIIHAPPAVQLQCPGNTCSPKFCFRCMLDAIKVTDYIEAHDTELYGRNIDRKLLRLFLIHYPQSWTRLKARIVNAPIVEPNVEPDAEPEDTPTCSICLAPCTQYVRVLPCGHKFHRRCIGRWSYRPQASCPTCRGPLR